MSRLSLNWQQTPPVLFLGTILSLLEGMDCLDTTYSPPEINSKIATKRASPESFSGSKHFK